MAILFNLVKQRMHVLLLSSPLFLWPFHYLGSDIEFSFSSFTGLLSVLLSHLCKTSLHLNVGLAVFRCPPTSMFSLLHLPLSFSLPVSVSLLPLYHLSLPDLTHHSPCHVCNGTESLHRSFLHFPNVVFARFLPKCSQLVRMWWWPHVAAPHI